jgi:phosphoglycolate phosphatase-like HAD superfamily hydrolase
VGEFPSVRPMLAALAAAGYALFAASGILDDEFRGELARRGLLPLFAEARGGDKAGFLASLKASGYSPVLFVGDTAYDRAAADAAGVDFALVGTDGDLERLTGRLLNDA